jgi:hypothetical protein
MTQQDPRFGITADLSPTEAFDKMCRISDWWTAGARRCFP